MFGQGICGVLSNAGACTGDECGSADEVGHVLAAGIIRVWFVRLTG